MRGPARQAVRELLDTAEEQGLCCIARSDTQRRQLSRAVACGIAMRPFPQIYAKQAYWDSLNPDERILVAAQSLQSVHPTWVFAGPTAALAHELWVGYRYCDGLYLATSRSAHTRHHGSLHRIVVSNDTPTTRREIQVTSFLRTIYDCLRTMPFCDALPIADSALRRKNVSVARLIANVNQRFARLPGLDRVRSILELADMRSENGGESVARAQIISLGFVVPKLQQVRPDSLDPSQTPRVDFAWELPDGTLVIGELDGRQKYTDADMLGDKDTVDALLAERRREAHLTLESQPVRIMRFSLAEAMNKSYFSQLLTAYGIPRATQVPAVALQ